MKPLLDACQLIGARVGAFADTRHYVSTGDVDANAIITSQSVTFDDRPARADLVAEEGDVLFARMQATDKVVLVTSDTRTHIWSTGFAALRPRPGTSAKWVSYWLRSRVFQGLKDALCTGATQKAINNDAIRELSIPLPPLSEQERIERILDEADALRRVRAQADERTSSIEAALFQDVFGSPAINPFHWPVESVGALYEESRGGVKCGPFGSALKKHEYTDSGVPVWGIPNVLPNQFVEAGSLYISHPKFEELRAYAVEPGDLLISRAGTVGRICVARPQVAESIIGTNLIRLTLDRKKVVPEFFSALMTHFAAEVGRLRADTNEGAYSFMNTTVLETLQIYLPPLKLQEGFAARVAEIRELKIAQVGSRKYLHDLFQSLLHRAFQGEL